MVSCHLPVQRYQPSCIYCLGHVKLKKKVGNYIFLFLLKIWKIETTFSWYKIDRAYQVFSSLDGTFRICALQSQPTQCTHVLYRPDPWEFAFMDSGCFTLDFSGQICPVAMFLGGVLRVRASGKSGSKVDLIRSPTSPLS